MDLNPQFTAVSSFRPAGDGGELKLFELAGINLVHGWLVDPNSPEYDVLARAEDYDNSVNMIVSADDLTKGQLVRAGEDLDEILTSTGDNWSAEERQKVADGRSPSSSKGGIVMVIRLPAIIIRDFLDRTGGQLTYHGCGSISPLNGHLCFIARTLAGCSISRPQDWNPARSLPSSVVPIYLSYTNRATLKGLAFSH